MITKKTVFVLGAGASQPYGFPTAYDLLEPVYASIRADSVLKSVLTECGFQADEVFTFCRRMKESGQYSIDAFVEREPRFLDIGKAAIAVQLLPHEHNLFCHDRPENTDWYRYLLARMTPRDRGGFSSNRLKVITFNFDRSFEWRLEKVLCATYDITAEEARKLASSIPVVHVHGELAGEPPPGDSEPLVRNSHPTAIEVMACVPGIQLGNDALRSEEVMKAHAYLNEAEVICFLGFSFNKDNLDVLQASSHATNKAVYGTRRGMSGADVGAAYNYFNSPRKDYLIDREVRGFFDVVDVFSR